jgi:hypothetical protein
MTAQLWFAIETESYQGVTACRSNPGEAGGFGASFGSVGARLAVEFYCGLMRTTKLSKSVTETGDSDERNDEVWTPCL